MIKDKKKLQLLDQATLKEFDHTSIDERTGEITGYWYKYRYSTKVTQNQGTDERPDYQDVITHYFDLFDFDDLETYKTNKPVQPEIGTDTVTVYNEYYLDYENILNYLISEDPKSDPDTAFNWCLPLFKQAEGAITVKGAYYKPNFSEDTEPDEPVDPDEPVEVVYVTPEGADDSFNNIKLGDKINGLVFSIEVRGHISDQGIESDTDIGDDKQAGILKAYDYDNKTDYFHLEVSGGANKAFDFYLNGQNVGHYELSSFSDDWKNDHSLRVQLQAYTEVYDGVDIPTGKVYVVPSLYIDDQSLTNYLSTGNKYIEFDVSGGTTELEAWMNGFQRNIWLYDLGNEAQDGQFAPNEFTWEISEVNLVGTELGNSFIETIEGQKITVNLTAADANTLTDGTNSYRLQEMGNLVR